MNEWHPFTVTLQRTRRLYNDYQCVVIMILERDHPMTKL